MDEIRYSKLLLELQRQNIDIAEMALSVGLTASSFRSRLTGETEWQLHEVADICDALGCKNISLLFLR